MSKKNELDQYHIKPEIADRLIHVFRQKIHKDKRRLVIEPSVGDGAFAKASRNMILIDLDPKIDNAIKQDFLTVTYASLGLVHRRDQIAFIGNPPFGFSGSLAVKFINHAATIGNIIAFVLPKSFKKRSIQRKLDKRLHLYYEEDLPKNSFILDGGEYDVPCVFQIWVKLLYDRVDAEVVTDDFVFVRKQDADETTFCVRRVGGRAGKVLDGLDHTESTTYWIKPLKDGVIDVIREIDFSSVVSNTAGVRSLSMEEIIEAYENNKVWWEE